MTRIVLSLALAVTSVGFAALGCGPDTTGGTPTGSGGTNPPSVPLEKASFEFSKAVCTKFFACCNMAELADALSKVSPQPTTVAECATAFQPAAEKEPFSYLTDRVMKGALVYDADKAGACFAALAADCSEFSDNFFDQIPACNGVYTGQVADGGACLAGIECSKAGSVCNGTMNGGDGTCGPLPKENEPCPDFECASGLVCFSDVMGLTCKQPVADGQMCGSSGDCASGYCDSTSTTCAPKKAAGEACDSYEACKDGFCDLSGTMKCTARQADGAACMSYDECISDNCDGSNKCAPPVCNGN